MFPETYFRKTKVSIRVTIADKSDPRALKILDELLKRYKENSPQSLDSYNFKSYSKISIDFDKDSISAYQNFIAKKKKDSIGKIQNRNLKTPENEKKERFTSRGGFGKYGKHNQYFLWEKVRNIFF